MEKTVNYKRKTILNFLSLPIGIAIICALIFLTELRHSGNVIADMSYLLYGIPFIAVFFILWNLKVIDDLITFKKNKKFVLFNVIILLIPYVLLMFILFSYNFFKQKTSFNILLKEIITEYNDGFWFFGLGGYIFLYIIIVSLLFIFVYGICEFNKKKD